MKRISARSNSLHLMCATFLASPLMNIFGVYFLFRQFNSFLASSKFCHLLITFANGLDPDQDPQNVRPDLDPKRLTL